MHADVEQNMEATRRLEALVERLTPEQLVEPLGGGWTVSMALGHLAFWDGKQRGVLEHFVDTGTLLGTEAPDPHNPDDQINEALEPLLALLDPDAIGELVVEVAQAHDELTATLSDAQLATILGGEHAYVARRWRHREEHIAQIESSIR